MTQELRKLADDLDAEFVQGRISNHNGRKAAAEIRVLLDRLEKAEKDAERYRWLRDRYMAVDFDWQGQQAVIFTADDFPIATASCDETIDSAMEASK